MSAMAPASDTGPGAPATAELLTASAGPANLDWSRIATHLCEHGMALNLDFTPRRFVGGLANINMLVRVDEAWAVLRRPPDGPLPKGAHDMAREHRVLSRLWRALPLAPRSLHYCAEPAVAGAPFQLLEYRAGRSVRGDVVAPLPPTSETGAALSALMLRTLSDIHAVDTTAIGLDDLGRPQGFLVRTAAGWTARAEALGDGNGSTAYRELCAWLKSQTAADTAAPTLLHNDFKLDNILLRQDTLAPEAVLDWDMATRGDPLFDLATLLSYWAEPGDPPCMAALAQMPTAKPGFLSREEAAQAYARLSGRSLDGFLFARVLAIFKLAVVARQLSAAATGSPDQQERRLQADPDELFAFALDVARGKLF